MSISNFSEKAQGVMRAVLNGSPITPNQLTILQSAVNYADWSLAKSLRDKHQLGGPGWDPVIAQDRADLEVASAILALAKIDPNAKEEEEEEEDKEDPVLYGVWKP